MNTGIWILSLSGVLAALPALADGVSTAGQEPAELSDLEETPAEEAAPAAEVTAVATPAGPRAYDVNRPWLLDVVHGPTAFVLDERQYQVGIEIQPRNFHMDANIPPTLAVRYGLNDAISLGLSTDFGHIYRSEWNRSGTMLLPEAKWNFMNTNEWSLAAIGGAGFSIGHEGDARDQPTWLEVVASHVRDDSHKTHYGISLGRNAQKYGYSYSNSWTDEDGTTTEYSSVSSSKDISYSAQLSATYEWRFHRRHGVSFGLAPMMQYEDGEGSYSSNWGSDASTSASSDMRVKVALNFGIGYHYTRERFGFNLGASMGPSWHRSLYKSKYESTYSDDSWNDEYSWSYSRFNIVDLGSIGGSIDYRF